MMQYLSAIRSFGNLGLTSLRQAFVFQPALTEIEANGYTSEVTDFIAAWAMCESLTSFPLLDVSAGTDFTYAWVECVSLTSFPELDVSAGTDFYSTWWGCSSLTTFPAGMFDTCLATNFYDAFIGCPLTSASVDNILVSLDTAGQSNGTLDMGGSCEEPGPAGAAAVLSLEGKGWTVTFLNGDE